MPPHRETSREQARKRVRAHRARLRAQGLRPIQIWVPDTRSPEFAAEAHRQSLAIAESEQDRVDQDWIESITDPDALYETR